MRDPKTRDGQMSTFSKWKKGNIWELQISQLDVNSKNFEKFKKSGTDLNSWLEKSAIHLAMIRKFELTFLENHECNEKI